MPVPTTHYHVAPDRCAEPGLDGADTSTRPLSAADIDRLDAVHRRTSDDFHYFDRFEHATLDPGADQDTSGLTDGRTPISARDVAPTCARPAMSQNLPPEDHLDAHLAAVLVHGRQPTRVGIVDYNPPLARPLRRPRRGTATRSR